MNYQYSSATVILIVIFLQFDYTIFLMIVPPIPIVIIYMKKLRASDWLKSSAFSYISSAKL